MLPATAPIRALPPYRRDPITWVAFVELLSFGVLNAGLGAALPFLRDAEHFSYLGGVLHQVAFCGWWWTGRDADRSSPAYARTAMDDSRRAARCCGRLARRRLRRPAGDHRERGISGQPARDRGADPAVGCPRRRARPAARRGDGRGRSLGEPRRHHQPAADRRDGRYGVRLAVRVRAGCAPGCRHRVVHPPGADPPAGGPHPARKRYGPLEQAPSCRRCSSWSSRSSRSSSR